MSKPKPMQESLPSTDTLEPRPSGPRIYKKLRQRSRFHFAGDTRDQSARRTGEGDMEVTLSGASDELQRPSPWDLHKDRTTLCLPGFRKEAIVHGGDEGYKDVLRKYFPAAESDATERMVDLKARLRKASTQDFWSILMEEMCDITGAQCALVAKRMLVDDQDSAVEMPDLGEPGSCLMGVAFYINNGAGVKEFYRDYRYHAYGTPCAHMKHDKVFIVPEKLVEVTPANPNAISMPWDQSEAFIGVPLFADGKCFAHFAMIWSSEGAARRKLGWNYLEMFMHSLEDMILHRIEGRGFAKQPTAPESTPAKIIPFSAITTSQSLKPYARSLSHELRTPMQGVVGMLDIMYSTVLDAIANPGNQRARAVFEDLKNHIEVVQDSSKRAVEAADNVVHAYDMNMQMPETPLTPEDIDTNRPWPDFELHPPKSSIERDLESPLQKKRASSEEVAFHAGPPLKKMFTMADADIVRIYCTDEKESCTVDDTSTSNVNFQANRLVIERRQSSMSSPSNRNPTDCRIMIRDFILGLLNEALRSDHPTRKVHTETTLGEKIEVTSISSRGEVQNKTVFLEIEPDVPSAIVAEEQHLQFSIQKVIDNAVKFTESGSITVTVRLGKNSHIIEVRVVDTGCGIDEKSKHNLFKPHFQQDASISRARDGLGLSLFNAKAHVRKNLGGDVTLERSATEGPTKGSEFLIRLPMSSLDAAFEAPIVGTPPLSSHCSGLLSPFADANRSPIIPSKSNRSGTESPVPGAGIRDIRLSSPIPKPRKRTSFNRKLAKDYPLNLLIAEDNKTNRDVAVGSLNRLGYSNTNITVAFDGLEAVQKFQANLSGPLDQRFNAILMDIWMPNMDGYEATRQIRELAAASGMPMTIIAVTADITSECLDRTKEVGMQGFLTKPYKVLDLEHLIVKHFPRIEEECC